MNALAVAAEASPEARFSPQVFAPLTRTCAWPSDEAATRPRQTNRRNR